MAVCQGQLTIVSGRLDKMSYSVNSLRRDINDDKIPGHLEAGYPLVSRRCTYSGASCSTFHSSLPESSYVRIYLLF